MTALEVIREVRSFGEGTFEDDANMREVISWKSLSRLLDRLERQIREGE